MFQSAKKFDGSPSIHAFVIDEFPFNLSFNSFIGVQEKFLHKHFGLKLKKESENFPNKYKGEH